MQLGFTQGCQEVLGIAPEPHGLAAVADFGGQMGVGTDGLNQAMFVGVTVGGVVVPTTESPPVKDFEDVDVVDDGVDRLAAKGRAAETVERMGGQHQAILFTYGGYGFCRRHVARDLFGQKQADDVTFGALDFLAEDDGKGEAFGHLEGAGHGVVVRNSHDINATLTVDARDGLRREAGVRRRVRMRVKLDAQALRLRGLGLAHGRCQA